MENLSIGQIVLASFLFSDLIGKKLRPCYIVGISEFDDIILCQITSQPYQSKRAVSLLVTDFKKGTIVSDSYIRPDKLATLDIKLVKQVLGTVTDEKSEQVKQVLKNILALE